MDTDTPHWFKSSHSAAETCCVEIALTASTVRVRDSTRPDGPSVGLAASEWAALLRIVSGV